jgi:hypothetical protein
MCRMKEIQVRGTKPSVFLASVTLEAEFDPTY